MGGYIGEVLGVEGGGGGGLVTDPQVNPRLSSLNLGSLLTVMRDNSTVLF